MARESHAAKQARVRKIIAVLKRTHTDAKLALDFTNPLELLVALILAAQARDDLVNLVTPDCSESTIAPPTTPAKPRPRCNSRSAASISFAKKHARSNRPARCW